MPRYFTDEEYSPIFNESFEEVCSELKSISDRLYELLPDTSLSPDERLERLARVIPTSLLISDNHKTARSKLNKIRYKLDELVPDRQLSYLDKLETLVNITNSLVEEDDIRFFKKLEKIGDYRRSDIGRPGLDTAPPPRIIQKK